jgi:hypothetical protein
MSQTFKIINGQLDMNYSNGQPNTVTGNRKCAQDVGECLLQDFLASQQYGSYLRKIVENPVPYSAGLLLQYYISDAINLLSALQQQDPTITPDEQIADVAQILTTTLDGDGTTGFFVSVDTESGQPAQIAASQITQINQWQETF